ncbi:MAG TPA: rhomboid family intramembrane serine protease [Kiloniellales bacterium]|jgi:membrane associated rhomboid family serine protease|nr:rhomboid family intramembrane serine protease [Kiloniellales bacterium]
MQPDTVGRPPPPPGSSSGGPAIHLPPVIGVLLGVLVLITAVMRFASPVFEAEILVTFGLYLFLDGQFQWHRLYSLITSVFLHDGWLHLLFNGLWIATLGSLIHRVLGNLGFLLLFFASAIAGGLVYTLAHWGETALAIGASGGVFGLIGAFGHLGIARPGQTRSARLKSLLGFTLIMMLLNLAYAYVGAPGDLDAQIAWEAHAGGFLAGILLMPLLYRYRLRHQLLVGR